MNNKVNTWNKAMRMAKAQLIMMQLWSEDIVQFNVLPDDGDNDLIIELDGIKIGINLEASAGNVSLYVTNIITSTGIRYEINEGCDASEIVEMIRDFIVDMNISEVAEW